MPLAALQCPCRYPAALRRGNSFTKCIVRFGVKIDFLQNLISAIISEAAQNQPFGSSPLLYVYQGRTKRKLPSACLFLAVKAMKCGGHRQQIVRIERQYGNYVYGQLKST